MTIIKACRDLMITDPFYGLFMLNISRTITTEIDTLAVGLNGINIKMYINQAFWDSLSDKEQIAILKHELMHVCLGHLTMVNLFSNHKIHNISADAEINQYIDDLPEGGITINYLEKEMNCKLDLKAGTKYYYDEIMNFKDDVEDNINFGAGSESGECDSKKRGDHGMWEEFDKLSEIEKKLVENQIESQLKSTAEQVSKTCGNIPGELKIKIESLYEKKEQIFNWKSYFRRLLGTSGKVYTKKSQRKFSKRFDGSAGLKIRHKQNILVAIDTSGSVCDAELIDFFCEIKHIYKTGASITIVECDTKINSIYEYNGIFKGDVTGRGGTYFAPPVELYNKNKSKYNQLIYFTDGEASLVNIKFPQNMIWVITSNGWCQDKDFPGKVIRIPKTK